MLVADPTDQDARGSPVGCPAVRFTGRITCNGHCSLLACYSWCEYNETMAKRTGFIESIRQVVRDDARSVNQIAKDTGIPQPTLHHFVHGRMLKQEHTFDALAKTLGLSVQMTKKARRTR